GASGAGGVEGPEVEPEHVAVEEEEGGERLVLGAGGDAAFEGEVAEELFDLGGAEVAGVSPAVGGLGEAGGLLDPAEVALLGAQGEVLDTEDLARLVEELHERSPVNRDALFREIGCYPAPGETSGVL